MLIQDWVSIIAALITLLGIGIAAFFGLKSLSENSRWQKIAYLTKVLDDLAAWAIEAKSASHSGLAKLEAFERLPKDARGLRLYQSELEGDLVLRLDSLIHKEAFFVSMAKALDGELQKAVSSFADELLLLQNICDKNRADFLDLPDDFVKFSSLLETSSESEAKGFKKLRDMADKLIEEATRVKLKLVTSPNS